MDDDRSWMTEPIAATVHLAFAFDIGDEVDLDRARLILQGEPGQLPRRRRTPESIRYRPAPIRVELVPSGIDLPGTLSFRRPPQAELTIFDFAAISLSVRFHLSITPEALLTLAGRLAEPASLTEGARRLLAPWLEQIRPAVYDFAVSELSEEYVVFQLWESQTDWLEHRADWIAGLVRLEAEPLEPRRSSRSDPALPLLRPERSGRARLGGRRGRRHRLRRHARSHRVRQRAASRVSPYRRPSGRSPRSRLSANPARKAAGEWFPLVWRLHHDAVRQIRELEIESTSLFERVDNALKLIGDHYLSRVFEVTGGRFHLRDWQQSIRRKLETVGDVYDLLIQQAGATRMEALEITVVILIALEIALAIFRH